MFYGVWLILGYVLSTVPAGDLAPSGARSPAGKVMTMCTLSSPDMKLMIFLNIFPSTEI